MRTARRCHYLAFECVSVCRVSRNSRLERSCHLVRAAAESITHCQPTVQHLVREVCQHGFAPGKRSRREQAFGVCNACFHEIVAFLDVFVPASRAAEWDGLLSGTG